jgi:hypothetical protein
MSVMSSVIDVRLWSAVPSGLRRRMRLGREDEPVEVFGSY